MKVQFLKLSQESSTVYCEIQFLSMKQDQLWSAIQQSNIIKCIKCFMNINYYELYSEVIIIEEFCMRCHIQQYLNDS